MAGAMSLLLYLAVLTVSVSSVLLGLDWLSSPPHPPAKHPVQVASTQSPAAVKKPVKPAVTPKPRDVAKTSVEAAKTSVVAAKPAPAATTDATAVGTTATASADTSEPDPPSGSIPVPADAAAMADAAVSPAPRCDVQACGVAYRSFRASDCTWQPFDGPRRFCDKGTPPKTNHSAADIASAAQARAPSCNVQACARAYQSFDATDCTYQPYEGPRQLCEK
jgi:hypothetical protein